MAELIREEKSVDLETYKITDNLRVTRVSNVIGITTDYPSKNDAIEVMKRLMTFFEILEGIENKDFDNVKKRIKEEFDVNVDDLLDSIFPYKPNLADLYNNDLFVTEDGQVKLVPKENKNGNV